MKILCRVMGCVSGTGVRGALALGATVCALAACQPGIDPNLAGPAYPAETKQATTLDIQVVRSETDITLTNTTARAFGKSRLWINRWYSKPIASLGVGETMKISLNEFRDQYGEPFRAGGFFASRTPDRVEQAQLETGDGMIGLIVVGRELE